MNQFQFRRAIWLGLALLLALWAGWRAQPVLAQSENGIISPAEGEVVSGLVEVTGRAQDPKLRRVELALLWFGDERRVSFLGLNNNPANGRIALFESANFPDGEHKLRMRLVRQDRNYDEYFRTIVIRNTGAIREDSNGITAIRPMTGITVTGPVRVTGVATDPSFRKWQLDLLRFEDPTRAVLLASDERPILTPGQLARFVDTTQFPDGRHALRLRVYRQDQSYQDYLTPVVIDNSRERTAANNGIAAPTAGEVLSCRVRVLGIADHPHFWKWQLDLLPQGEANRATFLRAEEFPQFTRSAFLTLDTTLFADGEYTIRLRVVRRDGNYDEHLTPITIANQGQSCQAGEE
jgi:hypothetical protein